MIKKLACGEILIQLRIIYDLHSGYVQWKMNPEFTQTSVLCIWSGSPLLGLNKIPFLLYENYLYTRLYMV
jgi:hypothetical protein